MVASQFVNLHLRNEGLGVMESTPVRRNCPDAGGQILGPGFAHLTYESLSSTHDKWVRKQREHSVRGSNPSFQVENLTSSPVDQRSMRGRHSPSPVDPGGGGHG